MPLLTCLESKEMSREHLINVLKATRSAEKDDALYPFKLEKLDREIEIKSLNALHAAQGSVHELYKFLLAQSGVFP